MGLSDLGYRPWEGKFHGAWLSPWPIARTALRMVFRRKLFWAIYAFALFNFVIFSSGIYLFFQIDVASLMDQEGKGGKKKAQLAFVRVEDVQKFVNQLRDDLHLAGSGETYRNFIWLQGYFVMAVLALAGTILIGNDYQYGSVPFYLSKPLTRWHYLFGKFLAVGLFANMLTTFPALLMFVECTAFEGWSYVQEHERDLLGILGYGMVLTVVLSILVITLASWLRKTVPLIMVWVGILFFGRLFASVLVDGLRFNVHWRLLDLWNSIYVVGSWCLHVVPQLETDRQFRTRPQPEVWEAAGLLLALCIVCLAYLNRRIRAVEIVR